MQALRRPPPVRAVVLFGPIHRVQGAREAKVEPIERDQDAPGQQRRERVYPGLAGYKRALSPVGKDLNSVLIVYRMHRGGSNRKAESTDPSHVSVTQLQSK